MVISVCPVSHGSRSTSTTLRRLGSGQVEQLQLKLSRRGGSSTRYSPLTQNSTPPSSMSIRSRPPTRMYTAWQQQDDPTRFVHLFEFADEAAHQAHGSSDAVRQFEAVYVPELVAGPVVFTNYEQIATNRDQ